MPRRSLFAVVWLVIALAAAPSSARNGSLTLYVYPPYSQLDWSTPRALWGSFLSASWKTRLLEDDAIAVTSDFGEEGRLSSRYTTPMGHTISRVECWRSNGERLDRWTSLSGMDDGLTVFQNAVLRGLGAGVITFHYRDGHILTGEENWKRLVYYTNEDKQTHPRYVRFVIDERACDRVHDMISFYLDWTDRGSYWALGWADPKQVIIFAPDFSPFESYQTRQETGEGDVGGGCAGWGAGLVKAAGQYHPLFDDLWTKSIVISERLFGGTRDEFGLVRHVSIPQILWGDIGRNWVHSGSPSRSMRYWEPTVIWDFIGEALSCMDNGCGRKVGLWLTGDGVTRGPQEVLSDTFIDADGKVVRRNSAGIDGIVVDRLGPSAPGSDRIAEK